MGLTREIRKGCVLEMEEKKVKKINVGYLLGLVLGPVAVVALFYLIGYLFFKDGGYGAVVCFMVPPMAAIAWYIFAGRQFYKSGVKKLERAMDEQGLARNQTFNGRGCTVCLDMDRGMVGLAFFWNPFTYYILPASRIGKTWVDDGCMGAGVMKGSSQVSFLFQVDDVKVRVYTFSSNRRWRMDSDYILTGISKADLMVEAIESAKGRVG